MIRVADKSRDCELTIYFVIFKKVNERYIQYVNIVQRQLSIV